MGVPHNISDIPHNEALPKQCLFDTDIKKHSILNLQCQRQSLCNDPPKSELILGHVLRTDCFLYITKKKGMDVSVVSPTPLPVSYFLQRPRRRSADHHSRNNPRRTSNSLVYFLQRSSRLWIVVFADSESERHHENGKHPEKENKVKRLKEGGKLQMHYAGKKIPLCSHSPGK